MRELVTHTAVIRRKATVTNNRSMNGTMLISLLVDRFLPPVSTSTPPTGNLRSIWGRPLNRDAAHATRTALQASEAGSAARLAPRSPRTLEEVGDHVITHRSCDLDAYAA